MENLNFRVAEIEISYRLAFKAAEQPQITSSADAYGILLERWDERRLEFLWEFKMVLLNRRSRIMGVVNISQGEISGTIADPKVIFAVSLKTRASAVLLAHNHPNGELSSSEADLSLTQGWWRAEKFLGLPFRII